MIETMVICFTCNIIGFQYDKKYVTYCKNRIYCKLLIRTLHDNRIVNFISYPILRFHRSKY